VKKRRFKHEPLDAVRNADPVDTTRLPSTAQDPRAQALFQEITSLPPESEAVSSPRSPKRSWIFQPAWAASAAVALMAGVIGTVALLGGGSPSDPPTSSVPATSATSLTIPNNTLPSTGFCVEFYDLETLANRDFAFDGTVTAVSGDQVTFSVNQWFLGDQVTEVTLTATGLTGGAITSAGGPSLTEGERFLVAGSETFVWSCGFTQAYDPAVASDWAGVFGG